MMFAEIIEVTGWIFMFFGAFFTFTGALGMLRMPDFYTRIHPAGLTDSLGVPLILIGVAIQSGFGLYALKILFLIFFLFLTGPTTTHVIAKSAALTDLKPYIKKKK